MTDWLLLMCCLIVCCGDWETNATEPINSLTTSELEFNIYVAILTLSTGNHIHKTLV